MDFEDLLNGYNVRTKIKLNETSNSNSSNNMWGAILSAIAGLVGSVMQNTKNTKQIQATNQANRELVQMQNKASAQEAEKAYQRSLPINQVNTMQAAGMSKAGAINALNGGGSYQPAPVNASQDTAPQVDYSDAINAMQSFANLQEQKRQFNLQHAEQKRQFNAEHALKQEEVKKRGKLIDEQIHDVVATYTGKGFDNAIKNIEYRIAAANEARRTSAEDAKYLAEEANAALDALKALKQTEAWSKMSSEQIAEYYELQAKLEILSNLGNTKATDLLAKIISIF